MTSEIDRLPKWLWFRQLCAFKVDYNSSVNFKQDTDSALKNHTNFVSYAAIIRYYLDIEIPQLIVIQKHKKYAF